MTKTLVSIYRTTHTPHLKGINRLILDQSVPNQSSNSRTSHKYCLFQWVKKKEAKFSPLALFLDEKTRLNGLFWRIIGSDFNSFRDRSQKCEIKLSPWSLPWEGQKLPKTGPCENWALWKLPYFIIWQWTIFMNDFQWTIIIWTISKVFFPHSRLILISTCL